MDAAYGHPAFDANGHGFDYRPGGSEAYDAYDHHVHTAAPEEGGRDDGTKGLAVLFCDLDGFKSINDRFGHNAGDAVLIEVARRLSRAVRDGDTVARLGGDEFVILADGLGRADAQDLAVRLRNEIIQPIRAEGRAVRVGASFGIGWAHCGMTADEVLKSADERMYVEKRSRPKQHRRAG
jgi:diguanylate cyclase (GGDEF)-like protein